MQRINRYRLPLAAALLLAGALLAWWQPWRSHAPATPRPVALVPTPTPTRAPERIALPPATPSAHPATPVAQPATPATPASPGPTRPRATGLLLYIGFLDGEPGIIAVYPDGAGQRLLVPGRFESLAWSPGGTRFAAVGYLNGVTVQLAIFTADGKAQARYPFDGQIGQLLWSPDGSALVCAVTPWGLRQGTAAPTETWLIRGWDEPQRVNVPDATYVTPFAWTPAGHLYVTTADPVTRRYSLWMVSPDGTYAYRDTDNLPALFGFSADGERLLAADIANPAPLPNPHNGPALNQVVAIDLRTNQRRTIVDADRLGAIAWDIIPVQGAFSLNYAELAPDGEHQALVVTRHAAPSTPRPSATPPEQAIVFMRVDGVITGTTRLPDNGTAQLNGLFYWSPDSASIAFFTTNRGTPGIEYALHILDITGAELATHAIHRAAPFGNFGLSWSPDGQWIAYTAPNGIAIVFPTGTHPIALVPNGTAPAWQPQRDRSTTP